MTPPEPFTLNPLERQSPLWLRFVAYLDERLAQLRAANDGALDALATAELRGRIAQIKAIRALGNEPMT